MQRLIYTLLLTALVGVGCGGESRISQTAAAQGSMADLDEDVQGDQLTIGGVRYQCAGADTALLYSTTSTAGEIPLGTLRAHLLITPGAAGAVGEVWIVGHDAATGHLRLVQFSDLNGDGVIESPTATNLFTTTSYINGTAFAFDVTTGTLFILDKTSGNVYRALDTTGNLRPNVFSATPFVAGTWDPNESGPQEYTYTDPDTGATETHPGGLTGQATELWDATPTSVYITAFAHEIGTFTDTNSDGVADTVSSVRLTAAITPTIMNEPLVEGMIEIEIRGSIEANVELREVDSNGATLANLGSIVLAEGNGKLTLASELTATMLVQVVDTSNALNGFVHTVADEDIHVDVPDEPWLVDVDTAEDLTFTGANLDLVASVILRQHPDAGAAEAVLQYTTTTDGRSITASIPALGDSWDGRGIIVFKNGAGDEKPHMYGALCKEGAEPSGGSSGGSGGGSGGARAVKRRHEASSRTLPVPPENASGR